MFLGTVDKNKKEIYLCETQIISMSSNIETIIGEDPGVILQKAFFNVGEIFSSTNPIEIVAFEIAEMTKLNKEQYLKQ